MSYIQSNLMDGERVIYQTRMHRVVLFWPVAISLAGFALGAALSSYFIAPAILLASAAFFMPAYIRYLSSAFGVTNHRLFIQVGWLSRQTMETPLMKVGAIIVNQDLLGRILGYGTVIIKGMLSFFNRSRTGNSGKASK